MVMFQCHGYAWVLVDTQFFIADMQLFVVDKQFLLHSCHWTVKWVLRDKKEMVLICIWRKNPYPMSKAAYPLWKSAYVQKNLQIR